MKVGGIILNKRLIGYEHELPTVEDPLWAWETGAGRNGELQAVPGKVLR